MPDLQSPARYYRTGQAALELELSRRYLIEVCKAGLIEAEQTEAGHWRIPATELERLRKLKAAGNLPEIPKEINVDASEKRPRRTAAGRHLLGAPSTEALQDAEQVTAEANAVEKLRYRKQQEELQDWFRERDKGREQEELAALEAEREAKRKLAADAQAREYARRRREWLTQWLDSARRMIPSEADALTCAACLEAAEERLSRLAIETPDWRVQRSVEAALEAALRPWRARRDSESAIEAAVRGLPRDSVAYLDAKEAARAAVEKLRADASREDKQAAAALAVEPFETAWRHARLIEQLSTEIGHLHYTATKQNHAEARAAVTAALEKLPPGCPESEAIDAREKALEPIRRRLQEQAAEERRQENIPMTVLIATMKVPRLVSEKAEFESAAEERETSDEVQAAVREALTNELRRRPMDDGEIDRFIEEAVEEQLDELFE